MAIILNDDDSLLDEFVGREWERLFIDKGSGWLTLDRMGWHSTPIGLQRRLVRKAIHTLLPNLRNVGFRTTEQAREVASGAHVGSKSSLPAGLSLSIGYDDLLFSVEDAAVPIQNLPQLKNIGVFDLPVPGRLTLGNGWIIQAQMLEGVNLRRVLENQDPWQAFVSVANPKGIIVRARRLGERFQPLGMSGGSTKVSRVMIDQKMPKRLRTKWPIVASHDHLLWLVGYHIDERASIGVESKKVLFLQAHKEVDA
jgi:tRNA(Ile)-lysidine synthase